MTQKRFNKDAVNLIKSSKSLMVMGVDSSYTFYLDARLNSDGEIVGTALRYNSRDLVRAYSYEDVEKILRNVKRVNSDIVVSFYYDEDDQQEEEQEEQANTGDYEFVLDMGYVHGYAFGKYTIFPNLDKLERLKGLLDNSNMLLNEYMSSFNKGVKGGQADLGTFRFVRHSLAPL